MLAQMKSGEVKISHCKAVGSETVDGVPVTILAYRVEMKGAPAAAGESYVTHRMVRGERIGGKVRQITVLPLGRHFPFKQEEWPLLCQRIEEITRGQPSLLQSPCPAHIERAAQRYGAAILARAPTIGLSQAGEVPATKSEYVEVDVNAVNLTQPRTVGVEHLGLHALSQYVNIFYVVKLGLR